ncbi:MAG: fasciclin domain-containing protein [Caldilineaceae bacterium]|nr:fasciclin domain-containing protein [Caldilineaceae bacterium]
MYMQSPVEEPVQLVVGEMTAAEEAEATPEPTEEAAAAPECMDIVDTAINADGFGTLVTAVQAAGLVDTLKSEGPFTVFAPADEAFAALPDGTLDALLEDPEGALKEVLLYHVIPDKLMAEDIAKMGSSVTAQGQSVTFTVGGNNIMVNDANVVAADIEACNGVIHVIDKVIIPAASEDAMAEAETTEAEMTPEATEEAVEEAAEATPEPTEEAMEEAVEATPEPTEEAMAEETMADAAAGTVPGTVPGTLPETGASLPTAATTIPTLVLVGIALTGAAYVTRRREE